MADGGYESPASSMCFTNRLAFECRLILSGANPPGTASVVVGHREFVVTLVSLGWIAVFAAVGFT